MRIALLFIFFFLSNSVFSQSKANISDDTYFNTRFGYCIKYPNKLLKPRPEAQNGDGRWFIDKKGKEVLVVYGARNIDIVSDTTISLNQLYELELKGGQFKEHTNWQITYSKLGKTFFVISGIDNGKIFYQKTIQLSGDNNDAIATAMLTYTDSEKATYAEVSKEIFSSLTNINAGRTVTVQTTNLHPSIPKK